MSYLYGYRRGMGQTSDPSFVPGLERGGAYGQPCDMNFVPTTGPDMPPGGRQCPAGTKCARVRMPGEAFDRGRCMPKCISTIECPEGMVCIDGVCNHPPNLNPPPDLPPPNVPPSGGCPKYRDIPIFFRDGTSCRNPDDISDADLLSNKEAVQRHLYNERDLAVGRLGTEADIEEVRLNKIIARMSVAERTRKYNRMNDMIRRLAKSYELTRKANEIAVVVQDSRMIAITLQDEVQIRNAIQTIRIAQFKLRQINIIETGQGLRVTGLNRIRVPVQGLGLPVWVAPFLWKAGAFVVASGLAYGASLLAADGIARVTKVITQTKTVEEVQDIALTLHQKEIEAYLACVKRLQDAGQGDVIKDVCSKPRSFDEILRAIEKENLSVLDRIAGGLTDILKLAAIGTVGYIAVPLIKDLVDDKRKQIRSRS